LWQPAFDGCFDEVRCEEGQRNRHIDVALAAGLPYCEKPVRSSM
jgi:hypothetical protein